MLIYTFLLKIIGKKHKKMFSYIIYQFEKKNWEKLNWKKKKCFYILFIILKKKIWEKWKSAERCDVFTHNIWQVFAAKICDEYRKGQA